MQVLFFLPVTDQHSVTWALLMVKTQQSGRLDITGCQQPVAGGRKDCGQTCRMRRKKPCSCRPRGCGWKKRWCRGGSRSDRKLVIIVAYFFIARQQSQTTCLDTHWKWELNQTWIKKKFSTIFLIYYVIILIFVISHLWKVWDDSAWKLCCRSRCPQSKFLTT